MSIKFDQQIFNKHITLTIYGKVNYYVYNLLELINFYAL
jgi:hypothetical protein